MFPFQVSLGKVGMVRVEAGEKMVGGSLEEKVGMEVRRFNYNVLKRMTFVFQ